MRGKHKCAKHANRCMHGLMNDLDAKTKCGDGVCLLSVAWWQAAWQHLLEYLFPCCMKFANRRAAEAKLKRFCTQQSHTPSAVAMSRHTSVTPTTAGCFTYTTYYHEKYSRFGIR